MNGIVQRYNRVLLCLVLCFVNACIPPQGSADIDPKLECATILHRLPAQNQPNAIEIRITAHSYRETCWRLYSPVLAAPKVTAYAIHAIAEPFDMAGIPNQPVMEQLLRAGNAPDLMHFPEPALPALAAAGYLTPLDDCRQQYREFDDILEPAWRAVTWQQRIWGIPHQISLFHLYFNQTLLQQLDWSPQAIAQLPARIARGEFTLEDLTQVAQTAIAAKVVAPGFGYWPYLDDPWTLQLTYIAYGGRLFAADQEKLVITKQALTAAFAFHHNTLHSGITHPSFADPQHTFLDKTMWEDAVAHGRVLFWVGGNHNWAWLTDEYRDDFAATSTPHTPPGYALYPAGTSKYLGVALITGTGIYVVPSAKATGRHHQAAVCALLAKTLTPEINVFNSVRSGHMSVLKAQLTHPAFQAYPFSRAQMAIWRQAQTLPSRDPGHKLYTSILQALLTAVQSELLTPAAATEQAVSRLQHQLGDTLIVE